MTEVLRFALVALPGGSLFALVALGIVVVYRASGVLNFAAGATGAGAAFVFYDLRDSQGVYWLVALVIALLVGAVIGLLTQVVLSEVLRRSSRLTKLIATLGVMSIIQGLIIVAYGETTFLLPESILPDTPSDLVRFGDDLAITQGRLMLIGIAVVLAVALRALYSKTNFGLATSAVAENRRVASSAGWSTRNIEMVNFALAGTLSAFAAIMLTPLTGLVAATLTLTVLPALAAALVGRFSSFSLTVVGALAIAVLQSEVDHFVSAPELAGLSQSVPLLVIVAFTVFSGKARQSRGDLSARLPLPGSGRIAAVPLIVGVAAATWLLYGTDAAWADATTTGLITGILVLSVVVVTGYCGQLSLAQFAFAGFGAWVAGRLFSTQGWSFELVLVVGVLATIPLGLLVALPALRTRGVYLAITTLGLATMISALIFNNVELTGGFAPGTVVKDPTFAGIDISAIRHPERYGTLVLVAFVLAGAVVANLRRGRAGRRLLAVRGNERAAAALGVGVYGAKIFAFTFGATIAALAGVLLIFRRETALFAQFDVFGSILAVQYAVVGGLGWASGAIIGAVMAAGSVSTKALESVFDFDNWVLVIGGATVIMVFAQAPDGIAAFVARCVRPIVGRLRRPIPRTRESKPEPRRPRPPAQLELRDVTVRFGGVTALDQVSLTVESGAIVGLMGPNGAGKTTLLDVATGFTKPETGVITLDGTTINRWSPEHRARSGVGRSWQAVELFDEITVRDNLMIACDPQRASRYLADLVHPGRQCPSEAVDEIVERLELGPFLDERPSSLSHGTSRIVGIARALAAEPSILFLDEPAAGLDQREIEELGEIIRHAAEVWRVGIVLVEHDVPFVLDLCERIVVLDFGRQIAEGTPAEIRSAPAVIEAYLGESSEVADGALATNPAGQSS